MDTLFRWIHLSDIHLSHGDRDGAWDQRLVLDELRRDIARRREAQPEPAIDAVFVTGDVGNTGAGRLPTEYTLAATWLREVGGAAGVEPARIFVVPGNHDVNRGADADPAVARLVSDLREGRRPLNDALAEPDERALLVRRAEKYLEFAAGFGPGGPGERLFWRHRLVARSGLPVRLIGLNTALLAAGDDDRGRLRVGLDQVAPALLEAQEGELVLALGHHPLRGGWLADEALLEPYLKRRVHVLLSGHVHEADAEQTRGGAGDGLLRVVAGAAHGDREPGVPVGHGYSFGSVVRGDDGKARVRISPRKWATKACTFRPDEDGIPEDRSYSEHEIALELPPRAAPTPPRLPAAPGVVRAVPNEPVPVFVSSSNAVVDARLREDLLKHVSSLRRTRRAAFRHSQEAPGGSERAAWVRNRLDEARVVLLLISRDYIGSDEYYEEELLYAIGRHERGEARVIPILIRKFSVSDEPFAKLQALPRDGQPVEGCARGEDAALAEVAGELIALVAEMRGESRTVGK